MIGVARGSEAVALRHLLRWGWTSPLLVSVCVVVFLVVAAPLYLVSLDELQLNGVLRIAGIWASPFLASGLALYFTQFFAMPRALEIALGFGLSIVGSVQVIQYMSTFPTGWP